MTGIGINLPAGGSGSGSMIELPISNASYSEILATGDTDVTINGDVVIESTSNGNN